MEGGFAGSIPGQDADRGDTADTTEGGSEAGMCATLAVLPSVACQLCIAQHCCDVCALDALCVSLVQCAENCPANDARNCLVQTCQNQWPLQVDEYDNFAICYAANCGGECPALP